jgi:hypothetical protein
MKINWIAIRRILAEEDLGPMSEIEESHTLYCCEMGWMNLSSSCTHGSDKTVFRKIHGVNLLTKDGLDTLARFGSEANLYEALSLMEEAEVDPYFEMLIKVLESIAIGKLSVGE